MLVYYGSYFSQVSRCWLGPKWIFLILCVVYIRLSQNNQTTVRISGFTVLIRSYFFLFFVLCIRLSQKITKLRLEDLTIHDKLGLIFHCPFGILQSLVSQTLSILLPLPIISTKRNEIYHFGAFVFNIMRYFDFVFIHYITVIDMIEILLFVIIENDIFWVRYRH